MEHKLERKTWFPWLFVAMCGILLPPIFFLMPPDRRFEAIVAIVGFAGGVTHFFYSQHHQDVELFHALFKEFTEQYDDLNNDLNKIRTRPVGTPLTVEEKLKLYDYFNLCAEEHLFHDAGYIDNRVWVAWCRGMIHFDKDEEIHALWEEELGTDSYYGFSLEKINAANTDIADGSGMNIMHSFLKLKGWKQFWVLACAIFAVIYICMMLSDVSTHQQMGYPFDPKIVWTVLLVWVGTCAALYGFGWIVAWVRRCFFSKK